MTRVPRNLYVVRGTTGEYSDRTEWLVAAYTDEAMAQTHAQLAAARARELAPSRSDWAYKRADERPTNAYDPDFQMYYTGTDYTVETVPLLRAVPRPEPS